MNRRKPEGRSANSPFDLVATNAQATPATRPGSLTQPAALTQPSTGWKPYRAANNNSAAPLAAPSAPATGEPTGIVYGFHRATEGDNLQVWSFRLERYHQGVRLTPIAVEMRGVSFSGFINEGDTVTLTEPWNGQIPARPRSVFNESAGTEVQALWIPKGAPGVALLVFLAFLGIVVTFMVVVGSRILGLIQMHMPAF